MNSRLSILFISNLTLVAIVAAMVFGLRVPVLRRVERQEQQIMIADMRQVLQAIEQRLNDLDEIAANEAHWDDLYQFIENRNIPFYQDHLTPESLLQMDPFVDLYGLLSQENDPLLVARLDIEAQQAVPLAEEPIADLLQYSTLLQFPPDDDPSLRLSSQIGLIATAQGSLLIAARPILPESLQGPRRGTVLVGSLLNQAALQALIQPPTQVVANSRSLQVEIIDPSDPQVPAAAPLPPFDPTGRAHADPVENPLGLPEPESVSPDLDPGLISSQALEPLSSIGSIMAPPRIVSNPDPGQVQGFIRLNDLNGTPLHVLKISRDRQINSQVLLLNRSTQMLVGSGILASIVMSLLIEKSMRNRQQQQKAEETLRSLLAAMTDIVLVVDRQGFCLEVVKTQSKLTHHLNVNPEGLSLLDILPPDQADICLNQIRHVLNIGEALPCELQFWVRGQQRWFVVMLSPLSDSTVLWVGQDMTERAQIMASLQQSKTDLQRAQAEAQAAHSTKSLFLAHMSHELRTPLNAILGFSQLIQRDHDLSPDLRRSIERIHRSGDYLQQLIDNVLDMSSIEIGRLVLENHDFDLLAMLARLKDMLDLEAKPKQLELQFTLDPQLPRWIYADEKRLRQVLINLLATSIKLTPTGKVELEAHYESDPSAKLQIWIRDTGSGIDPTELEHLFQPSVQSDPRIQADQGVGLALSRQLVHLMGGTLQASRTPGDQGAIFSMAIPIQIKTDSHQIPPPQPRQVIGLAPGQPRYRILVVDDQSDNREILTQLLESVGLEVQTATTGMEAIDHWRHWRPDLIWMDLQMPEMDGIEATQQIRADPEGQSVVIVVLTASATEGARHQIKTIGCDDFLAKPFKHTEIWAKLAKHLGLEFTYVTDTDAESDHASLPAQLQALKLADLANQSPVWLEQLHAAALALDSDRIGQLIHPLQQDNPELMQQIQTLVDTYNLEQLSSLTGQLLKQPRQNQDEPDR